MSPSAIQLVEAHARFEGKRKKVTGLAHNQGPCPVNSAARDVLKATYRLARRGNLEESLGPVDSDIAVSRGFWAEPVRPVGSLTARSPERSATKVRLPEILLTWSQCRPVRPGKSSTCP